MRIKCQVCGEKCDWRTNHVDYESIYSQVHKKCMDKFHILEADEVAVKKEDLKNLKRKSYNCFNFRTLICEFVDKYLDGVK